MSHDGITEVGKYRIVEQIGEGAMGVVYRALDPVLNRSVAIKVMSDALARDDDLRKRFLREAQAAGSLQHPNVVTIYDFGEINGHLFIAMEFVEGEDLETLLQRHAPLSLTKRVDILVDVLGGLSYAHKRGIVHRDIKPANIRIDSEGRARIMDFGIAHLSSSTMTRTGFRVGTPAYMAPEQVTGGPVSPATDIFSVGAVMYELFSGKNPFDGDSLQSVFYKIVNQSPPELTTVSPDVPAAFNPIVTHALAKDPAQRYGNAVEMANALTEARAALDRYSTHPKAISLRSSIESGLRARTTADLPAHPRRPVTIAAAAVLVLAAVGIAALALSRGHGAAVTQSGTVTTANASRPPAPRPDPQAVAKTAAPAGGAAAAAGTAAGPDVPAASSAAGKRPGGEAAEKASQKPPSKQLAAQPALSSPAPASPGSSATTTPRELDLIRSLQASALDARRRASDAGATNAQLQPGDDHNRTATTLVQQGKISDAATHLNEASAAWAGAERDARTAAAAAAAKMRVTADIPKPDQGAARSPVPPVQQTVPQNTTPRVSAAQAPPQPQVDAPTEIQAVVAAYARAIESRDLANVKRAYPGISADQASGFEQFFGAIRSMHVTFSVGNLDVRGDAADAQLTGTYDYVTSAGRDERQPVTARATFRRENGAWKLMSVR